VITLDRVTWQSIGTRPLLVIDAAHLSDRAELMATIARARQVAGTHAPRKILTLFDVSGSQFHTDAIRATRELAAHNRPYVAWGAVVGLSPLSRVIYELIVRSTGRFNLKSFATRDDAMRWLADQPEL
jgi:hypothetical protein